MLSSQLTKYVELGYRVFPCGADKKPLTEHGCKDATTDLAQIEAWFTKWPDCNWAIATNGLIVIDVDMINKGTAEQEANPWPNDDEKSRDLAQAPMVRTASGGKHFYFRQPPGSDYRNSASKLAANVDTRATGGYVLVPPSKLNDGKQYEWVPGSELEESLDRLPLPPDWLLRALVQSPPVVRIDHAADGGTILQGQRDSTLTSLAGTMRRRGMTQDEIAAALRVANANRCKPPLPESDVDRIARSIACKPPGELMTKSSDAGEFQPFPVDVLPEPIRSYVTEAAAAIGCDPSFIALPMLAALAASIGNTRRIRLKPTWSEPSVLWTALVGDSGTLKTPALSAATMFLEREQVAALTAHERAASEYKREMKCYEAKLRLWQKKAEGNPPDEPVPPIATRYIVSDTTVEALASVLQNAQRGLILVRDEVAGWLNSFDQYKGGKGGDAAHWLSLFNAKPLIIDRKSGTQNLIHVPIASVSVAGGIQPGTLRRALGQEHFENGLAARLLLAYPPKRPRVWTDATVSTATESDVAAVFSQLLRLDFGTGLTGKHPIDLPLTSSGREAWVEFFNRHGVKQGNATGDEAAMLSKLEGYCPRLALVTHLVRRAAGDATLTTPDEVDEVSMAAGITLADWFGAEGRRVYAHLDNSGGDGLAAELRELREYVRGKDGIVTARELTQGPRRYRGDSALAEMDLQRLVVAGIGVWQDLPVGDKGGRPTRQFRLATPGYGYETSVNPDGCEGSVAVAASEPPAKSAGELRLAS